MSIIQDGLQAGEAVLASDGIRRRGRNGNEAGLDTSPEGHHHFESGGIHQKSASARLNTRPQSFCKTVHFAREFNPRKLAVYRSGIFEIGIGQSTAGMLTAVDK